MKKSIVLFLGIFLGSILVGCSSSATGGASDGVTDPSDAKWKLTFFKGPMNSGAKQGDIFEFNDGEGIVERGGKTMAFFSYDIDDDTIEIDFDEDDDHAPDQYRYSYTGDFDSEEGTSNLHLSADEDNDGPTMAIMPE